MHKEQIKKRVPKHLVISNVFDHLAQKNLLKKVLAEDQRATSRAIKELLERMRAITTDALELEVDVTFLGPPGFQSWPQAVQVTMLCLKEATKKLGVHFTYGASNLPVNKQILDSLNRHTLHFWPMQVV